MGCFEPAFFTRLTGFPFDAFFVAAEAAAALAGAFSGTAILTDFFVAAFSDMTGELLSLSACEDADKITKQYNTGLKAQTMLDAL